MLRNFASFLIFFFISSNALTFDFDNFQDVDNCIKYNKNIDQYKNNVQQCLDSKKITIDDEFLSSVKTKLPDNFHQRVDFGNNVNQFLDKKYIPNNPKLTIDEFIQKYPNHIFTIDTLLRGEEPIISDYQFIF